jgi:hypothetical protein
MGDQLHEMAILSPVQMTTWTQILQYELTPLLIG